MKKYLLILVGLLSLLCGVASCSDHDDDQVRPAIPGEVADPKFPSVEKDVLADVLSGKMNVILKDKEVYRRIKSFDYTEKNPSYYWVITYYNRHSDPYCIYDGKLCVDFYSYTNDLMNTKIVHTDRAKWIAWSDLYQSWRYHWFRGLMRPDDDDLPDLYCGTDYDFTSPNGVLWGSEMPLYGLSRSEIVFDVTGRDGEDLYIRYLLAPYNEATNAKAFATMEDGMRYMVDMLRSKFGNEVSAWGTDVMLNLDEISKDLGI